MLSPDRRSRSSMASPRRLTCSLSNDRLVKSLRSRRVHDERDPIIRSILPYIPTIMLATTILSLETGKEYAVGASRDVFATLRTPECVVRRAVVRTVSSRWGCWGGRKHQTDAKCECDPDARHDLLHRIGRQPRYPPRVDRRFCVPVSRRVCHYRLAMDEVSMLSIATAASRNNTLRS